MSCLYTNYRFCSSDFWPTGQNCHNAAVTIRLTGLWLFISFDHDALANTYGHHKGSDDDSISKISGRMDAHIFA